MKNPINKQPERKIIKHETLEVQQHFSGPLPHPSALKEYEEIQKGAANRIIEMAEKEQNIRHTLSLRVIKNDFLYSFSGLIVGFIIAIVSISAFVYLSTKDKPIAGFTVFIGGLATLVSSFIYKKHYEKQNDEKETNTKK